MVEECLPSVHEITIKGEGPGRNRVYLVDADVPTLIDAGFEDTVPALVEGVEAVGLEPERLIITHGDPDHLEGFDAVTERYAVETWVPEQTDMGDLETEPDHRYGDGASIGPYTAVYTPGHEADHYSLVDEAADYCLIGDAAFGADLRGLPEGYLIPPPALYSENLSQAEQSLETLLDYDFDAVLVFHGSSVLSGGKDRLDAFINFPGKPGWATYLRED